MTIARDPTATGVLVGRILVSIFWLIPFATSAAFTYLVMPATYDGGFTEAWHSFYGQRQAHVMIGTVGLIVTGAVAAVLIGRLGEPSPIGRGPIWRAAKASLLVFWLVQTWSLYAGVAMSGSLDDLGPTNPMPGFHVWAIGLLVGFGALVAACTMSIIDTLKDDESVT